MTQLFVQVSASLLVAALTGVAGFLGGRLRELGRRARASDTLLLAMARSELVDTHRRWVIDKGYVPAEVKAQVDELYKAYADMGGNGVGEWAHDEIMGAHVAPGEE